MMDRQVKVLILKEEGNGSLIEYELSKSTLPIASVRVHSIESFLHALKDFTPDLILADQKSSKFDSMMALALVQEKCPEVPFIFMSADMSVS